MKLSTIIKKLNPEKKVYNLSDYEIRNGKKVKLNLIITPLNFSDGLGFYVYKDEEGDLRLEGEGWIFENSPRKASEFAAKERKSVEEQLSNGEKFSFYDLDLNEVKV